MPKMGGPCGCPQLSFREVRFRIVDVRWDGTLLTWSGAGWTIRGSGVASFDVGMGFVWLIGSKGISYLYNF